MKRILKFTSEGILNIITLRNAKNLRQVQLICLKIKTIITSVQEVDGTLGDWRRIASERKDIQTYHPERTSMYAYKKATF